MAQPQPSLETLVSKITELTGVLTSYLREKSIPEPTLAADSSDSYAGNPPEIWWTRQLLLDNLMDMVYLVQGPGEGIGNFVHSCMPDAAALNVLNHFDFWSAVPLDGSASYEELASKTSLPPDVVKRILQHAMTLRIFTETEPGQPTSRVVHTSRSAILARSSGLRAMVSTVLDGASGPMMVMHEALDRFSRGKPELAKKPEETSFALFHSGQVYGNYVSTWDLIENDGEGDKKGWRSKKYAEFMRYCMEVFHLQNVVMESHDWKALGKATVVDIGGSGGHDATTLAKNFPDLTIVVQDLAKVKPAFEANVPAEYHSQISFMEHSFFDPQPLQADVYILKMILHDWSDDDSTKILQGLIPALKPGARLLLFEYVANGDDEGQQALPRSVRQMGTASDLKMMALFNGKERPVQSWKDIISAADPRFEVAGVNIKPHSSFAAIEVVWRG